MTALAGFKAQRQCRIEPSLLPPKAAVESPNITSFASQRDSRSASLRDISLQAMSHRSQAAEDRSRASRDWNVRSK
jgi:hypothetical protein